MIRPASGLTSAWMATSHDQAIVEKKSTWSRRESGPPFNAKVSWDRETNAVSITCSSGLPGAPYERCRCSGCTKRPSIAQPLSASFECLVPNLINSTALQPDPLALDAVRRRFYSQGKTVTDWAREHGFDVHLVYGVLNGRLRARRGESHRIAVALGLKAVEDSEHSAASDATNSTEAPMKS